MYRQLFEQAVGKSTVNISSGSRAAQRREKTFDLPPE